MKTFNLITLQIVVFTILLSYSGIAQIQNSSLVAKFGIDGDLYSDYRQNGTFTAAGSHDWFKTSGGTGIGIIDTTGAAGLKTLLSSGKNIAFTRGSSIPRFSIIDTFMHMDAIYGRDYNNNDKTCFTSGSKNGDDPGVWGTNPSGGMVQDKSDIIDAYATMRRNGTSIKNTNPSRLILTMGSTLLGTTGSRYVDFELYVNRLSYDTITGIFSNLGLASKGGHEDFQFNADGSLKKIGDVDVSLSYNSANVTEISVYIWVNIATYLNTFGQQKFNFVPGEFYGAGNGATWGYAKIVAKAGNTLPLWGSVNSGTITGPAWGTASKDLGSSPNNYFFLLNALGQFSETAVDLSSIGIDPAFNNTAGNRCNPPFTRILIKTRSSASFTSALVDFAGPYQFLDAPVASLTIAAPQTLTCSRLTVNLSPGTIDNGTIYSWTTSNGSITGKTDTSVITINKPGKYYLTASANGGCNQNMDSVMVALDNYKPVASASSFGMINQTFTNTAQLLGGDASQSNYITPFGGSTGLLWSWSNTLGFSSAIQNPLTRDTGWHQLVVTESRNGCKDTAKTYVLWYNAKVLETKFGALTATPSSNQKMEIKWIMKSEDGNELYELERSEDGVRFEKIYSVSSASISNYNTYQFSDNIVSVSSPSVFYRIKMVLPFGGYFYTTILKVNNKKTLNSNYVTGVFQKSSAVIQVNYFTENDTRVELKVLDMSGKVLAKTVKHSVTGSNTCLLLNNSSIVKNQIVLVQVVIMDKAYTKKMILF